MSLRMGLALLFLLCIAASQPAHTGARLPVDTPIRAGVEMGMKAAKTGHVVATPVRVWCNVTLLAEQLPGVSFARDVGLLNGTA